MKRENNQGCLFHAFWQAKFFGHPWSWWGWWCYAVIQRKLQTLVSPLFARFWREISSHFCVVEHMLKHHSYKWTCCATHTQRMINLTNKSKIQSRPYVHCVCFMRIHSSSFEWHFDMMGIHSYWKHIVHNIRNDHMEQTLYYVDDSYILHMGFRFATEHQYFYPVCENIWSRIYHSIVM